jgi:hypothetical protein
MTSTDAAWMIDKIRQLDRPHIEAIVAEARLSNPDDAQTLVDILMQRRAAILSLPHGHVVAGPRTGRTHVGPVSNPVDVASGLRARRWVALAACPPVFFGDRRHW